MKLYITDSIIKVEESASLIYRIPVDEITGFDTIPVGSDYRYTIEGKKDNDRADSFSFMHSQITKYYVDGVEVSPVPAFATIVSKVEAVMSASVTSSDVNISQVGGEDVVADNASGASVTKVIPVGGKYNSTPPSYTDGDVVMSQYNTKGSQKVSIYKDDGTIIETFGGPASGDVAHDAADSGNPVKVGGKATAALPTAVTEGDRVQQSYDLYGQARVVPEVHSYIQATHFSPADGSVAFTSTSTLTASAFPFTVDISTCNIRSVMVTTQTYTSILYENGIDGVNITSSSNVISVYQRGVLLTPFAATDLKYGVAIAYQNKGYNPTTDTNKVSEDSPNWMRYTGPETLIASSQTITGSAADLGYEIDCQGYTRLLAYITLDINDAADVRIQALGKHTSAGAEEYKLPIKTVSSSDVKVLAHYYEIDSDADQLIILDWDVTGIAYVQLQVWAGTAGTTGAITAAYATKMY